MGGTLGHPFLLRCGAPTWALPPSGLAAPTHKEVIGFGSLSGLRRGRGLSGDLWRGRGRCAQYGLPWRVWALPSRRTEASASPLRGVAVLASGVEAQASGFGSGPVSDVCPACQVETEFPRRLGSLVQVPAGGTGAPAVLALGLLGGR